MSSDSVPPKNARSVNPKRPIKGAGKGTGKGLKRPSFLAKIPLPYLAGGVVGILMILFVVIKAAMTPLPGEMAAQQQSTPTQQSSEQQQSSPVEQPVAQQQPVPVPAYGGPSETMTSGVDSGLPLVSPYGQVYEELGRRVRMDLETFEKATTLYEIPDIGSDTATGYGMRLPKSWVPLGQGSSIAGAGVSDILAHYISPPVAGNRQSFKVEIQKLPFTMDIRDFMALRAKTDLITYQNMSIYAKNRAEALYVTTENNVSYVVRSVAILSGDRVLTADYRVPSDQFDAEQDMQTWAITRFYMIDQNDNSAEDTKPADFLDLGSFEYPVSWRVQAMDIKTLERMRISVSNVSAPGAGDVETPSLLNGQIDVVLFARDSVGSEARMIDDINTLLSLQGMHLGEPTGRFDTNIPLKTEKIFARVYPLINKDGIEQSYQYWLLQVKAPRHFFMIGLFTPTRDQNLKTWIQNHAAFRTVVETVKEAE